MYRYIIKRLLWMIPVILGVIFVVFTLLYFAPGDPVEIILGEGATVEEEENLRIKMGLDKSYIERFVTYLGEVFLHGNLGVSYISKVSITASLIQRLPRTILMAVFSLIVSMGMGIPMGVYAAVHQDTWKDRGIMLVAMLGISMPNFWLALLLVILFSVHLGWLPASGIGGLKYYILPALAGSSNAVSAQARQARSAMLEVIRSDYITMARSKGVPERRVIYGHALPNAIMPMITIAGTRFGHMLGGTLIMETIFSIPGVGSYIIDAVNLRDYPVVQGGVIFLAVAFGITMLLVDLLYAFIDPRIKAQYASHGARRKKDG